MNCSPVVIEVQGNGTEANFTVNPKKPQPIHSWNADHGDIGLLLSNTRQLQCVRLGGGNTKDGKTVGTFMDIMPSWSQFINGTIYVPIRSTKAVLTIIADEDGKNDMYVGSLRLKAEEWNNITYGSKTAYYYSREIFTGTMPRSLYYYNVHSSGHYIAQITGINKNGSSYGYTPALYDTTMDRPKPSEPAPVTTSTSSPSSSSSPSSPSSPSSSSSLSTERISSSTEGSEISTSTPSGTSSPIGQNAVMFAAFAVASLMLQIL
ncbi:hypothetical protein AB6A40_008814 [Gnathostoma spinigerum]|uniref:Uncharacterized protein n=1 Tax=Gnathostoma spinigerum TaxID=75299 RepID=A0ABD6ERD3_9BILA